MIYNSLDTIPHKTFLKIAATGDFSLLSDAEESLTILQIIWEKLFQEHLELDSTPESKREFRITLDVESLEMEHKFIVGACDCLEFDIDDELIEILKSKRYVIRTDNTENYYHDINQVKRFAKGLNIKIKTLKNQLPKEDSEENQPLQHEKLTIDDIMCGYADIMGFDFDYNTVSYMKFRAIKRQVNKKMKQISEQNAKAKK